MIQPQVISVSDLTKMIKQQLEQPMFSYLAVEGEISNFKHHTSGHMYFTLKDERSRIKAVMFRSRNAGLNFKPKDGDTVIVVGSIGVYEPNGEYQIYLEQMLPQGVGALHIKFEELKKRLAEEGLFAQERKKPLPYLPRRIGIITSPTGAAVRDCISVIRRRYPSMDILIIPAIVQGDEGPRSITAALEIAAAQNLDIIILTRGGGSIEELWSFNDESVARAIAACPIPVISGVGHETDFTIADFAADLRAPTPSAAAEIAVPDYEQLVDAVEQLTSRLSSGLKKLINEKRQAVEYLTHRRVFLQPEERINREHQKLDELSAKISTLISHRLSMTKQNFVNLADKLDSLSPLAVLGRGYAVCQKLDQSLVTDPRQVAVGEQVMVKLRTGQIRCLVEKGESHDG
ncbi:MAG: exodeoxyribonuclease VII large subunit [Candidatus Wallacebacter cryptica]|jgi:exodeoxyribonuclease VII large subunit|nr:exodeoxyribonuclease VII large subunit [Bacillota bacterium]